MAEATPRRASVMNNTTRRASLLSSPDKEPLEACLSAVPRHLYLRRDNLKVAIGTWNVQGARQNEVSSLVKWVQGKRGADVVVLGMQEVGSSRSDGWIDRLDKELLTFDFVKVISKFKVNLVTAVYVAARHLPHVHNTDREKTRVSHAFSGKGALAIRFTMYSKRFLFINCHLDHSIKSSEKRDSNYQAVLNEIEIGPPKHCSVDPVVNLTERSSFEDEIISPASGRSTSIDESEIGKHDYVFWFGNLNYRVSASADEVLGLIARKKYSEILKYDQMSVTMKHGTGFAGFEEAPITFPPTYKYFKDKDAYDCSKRSGVKRVPSYTDRVLWSCLPAKPRQAFLPPESNKVLPLKYKAYKEYRASDHRPLALMAAAAVYVPCDENIERIEDLRMTGKSPQQIAEILGGELGLDPWDVGDLYAPIEHDDTLVGPGTVYSSDEDEESVAARQQRWILAKVESLEKLVAQGPLSRTNKVRELRDEMRAFYVSTETFRATTPRMGGESYELLGEMCVNTMDRVDTMEDVLNSPVTCEKTLKWNAAVIQLAEQADLASDLLDTMMAKTCHARTPHRRTDCHYDPYNLRAAYFSGYMLGTRIIGAPPVHTAQPLPTDTPMLAALQRQLEALEAREEALTHRESEVHDLTDRVNARGALLRQRLDSLPSEGQVDLSELDKLMRSLEEKELEILRHRAALSKEQLHVAEKLAEQEATHASHVVSLSALEDDLDKRTLNCELMQGYLDRPKEVVPQRRSNWVPGPGGGGGAIEINPNLTSYKRFSKRTKGQADDEAPPARGDGHNSSAHFKKLNKAARQYRHGSPPRPASPNMQAPTSPTMHSRSRACYRSNSVQPRCPSNSFLSLLHGAI
eukprot:TRINITY_DN23878_c0_g1_i1.p1 TRINITY_DN23878_c0_g1~~TRINITY_DN23878_c0_g1_i1.p1  ORF type:complete len:873 (+),score=250.20 TRINITY_DN23878_c0_g1_i1:41-2620(+)